MKIKYFFSIFLVSSVCFAPSGELAFVDPSLALSPASLKCLARFEGQPETQKIIAELLKVRNSISFINYKIGIMQDEPCNHRHCYGSDVCCKRAYYNDPATKEYALIMRLKKASFGSSAYFAFNKFCAAFCCSELVNKILKIKTEEAAVKLAERTCKIINKLTAAFIWQDKYFYERLDLLQEIANNVTAINNFFHPIDESKSANVFFNPINASESEAQSSVLTPRREISHDDDDRMRITPARTQNSTPPARTPISRVTAALRSPEPSQTPDIRFKKLRGGQGLARSLFGGSEAYPVLDTSVDELDTSAD